MNLASLGVDEHWRIFYLPHGFAWEFIWRKEYRSRFYPEANDLADKTEAEITALGEKLRGAIILASPPQTVFTLTDRLQPADTDQPVRIGGPEPPAERQATSVVAGQHDDDAPPEVRRRRDSAARHGAPRHDHRWRQSVDAQGFGADRDRDGRALQHDRADDADRRHAAAASRAAHRVSGEPISTATT